MYYHDPDANLVELQVDNFGDWDKSKHWMQTSPEFEANPVGVFFDPERVNSAFLSGQSASGLHVAIFASRFLPAPLPVIGPPAAVNL